VTTTAGPRVGEELDVAVEKGVYRGLGLARHDGRVVFVPRGLPGDRLRVRVTSASRGFLRVLPLDRAADGPGRRASPCSVSDACGGCAYQELDYGGQLALKEAILRESLARAGAPFEDEILMTPSPEEGWRTRASLHLASGGPDGLRLGLHEEGSHRLVEFDPCLQLSRPLNSTLQALKRALGARASVASRLQALELAESPDSLERVAALSGGLRAEDGPALAAAAAAVVGLTGLGFWRERRGHRDFILVRGDPHVHATVLGQGLRAHVGSFFQANRFLVEELARAVIEMVPAGGCVLDLYCGVGLFSIPLAARGDEVMGAEISESALYDASANGRDLPRARFFRAEVREALARWPQQTGEHVVLDPPRAGAGREVVEAIASRRPAVVAYVSCDPPTLGRDLAEFARRGFRAERMVAFDMFPNTFHLETVVRLVPA
jgi:tRNA/tmRNA/rRNA uracil-C5-methylase (TrmA/RlmC/RlmD family)